MATIASGRQYEAGVSFFFYYLSSSRGVRGAGRPLEMRYVGRRRPRSLWTAALFGPEALTTNGVL